MRLLERHQPVEGLEFAPDAEALIREAKQRERRRRLGVVVVVLLLAGAAGAIVSLVGGSSSSPRSVTTGAAPSGPKPIVDVKAFSREGDLAFISQDRLWTLDGTQRSVRELSVAPGFVPASPSFSPDGRWLAYVATYSASSQPVSKSAVWIAHANGTGAHEVAGPNVAEFVGWSPTSDELALTLTSSVRYPSGVPGQVPATLEVIRPGGTVRRLVTLRQTPRKPLQIENSVWSPDGRAIAISVVSLFTGGSTIRAYPVGGGAPSTWFSINGKEILPGVCTGCGGGQTVAQLAGWWANWGIGFWVFSSGMTHNNDNTPIELLTAPGATPSIIGQTLSDGMTEAIASGVKGALAIVASAPTAGREYGQGKFVEICHRQPLYCSPIPNASIWSGKPLPCAPQACTPQPVPGSQGSGVTVDPAWSPDGRLLAFVNAPAVPSYVAPIDTWYATHELDLLNTTTHRITKVASLRGVSVPTWSRDGKDLLYVDNDSLWLWAVNGGKPVVIASPLFPRESWDNGLLQGQYLSYYDQVDWIGQFSWWSP